jgi:hypothetical protein
MPDRVIRDELLTSERYWSVSIQAQQLYVHLLLVADDAARCSGKNFTLRATCFPGRPMEHAAMEKMLAELVDADLIRAYTVACERFLFVPRFRNRRRYVSTSKYPTPPNEINDLPTEKSALSQPQVSPKTRGVGVGVGVGEKIYTRSASGSRTKTLGISDLTELGVDRQTAEDWLTIRAKKRSPLTKTSLKAIQNQATEAGLTLAQAIQASAERGWVGFRADWWRNGGGVVETDWHETRGGVERRAEAMGLGKWDEAKERWAAYRTRVIKAAKETA